MDDSKPVFTTKTNEKVEVTTFIDTPTTFSSKRHLNDVLSDSTTSSPDCSINIASNPINGSLPENLAVESVDKENEYHLPNPKRLAFSTTSTETKNINVPIDEDIPENNKEHIKVNDSNEFEKPQNDKLLGSTVKDQRSQILTKQMEYYFSDDNMKYDAFFRKEMEENHDPFKGWLKMSTILNCPRIKKLQCSQQEILDSIKSSKNIEYKLDSNNMAWLASTKPLPDLQERPINRLQKKKKSTPDYHLAGCLIKISEIPSEINSWVQIKTALHSHLPEGSIIKFTTDLKSKGTCNIWIKPFPGDKNLLNNLKFNVEEATLVSELMSDENEIKQFLNVEMPKRLRMQREKLVARTRSKLVQQPLFIAEQTFHNVEHLKKCIGELLEKTPENSFLKSNSAAENVVKSLLSYHPNGIFKNLVNSDNFVGIKVLPATSDELKKGSKCFAIASNSNENNTDTPFRFDKCIWGLSRDPPIANNQSNQN